MRIDRTLTLSVFHPLRKKLPRPRGIRIPILMYHSISDETESGHPYFWINTSPKRFAEHMRLMKENDYKVISLTDAADFLGNASTALDEQTGKDSHPRYAVVTFDDGFADFRTEAFPILADHGFSATVFLPTGFISDSGSTLKGKMCLRWDDVRELAESGVRFGSHTISHPKLRGIPWDQVEMELRESRKAMEDRLGTQVESFSYPYAFPEGDQCFQSRLKTSLGELGYVNGVTTRVGTAAEGDDKLFFKRIPVNSGDDAAFFIAKLEGGYDWFHGLQYGFKVLKGNSTKEKPFPRN
jgi:peptidoglycan/xylan/chitin deacetylase (PgdA/CDA1 family)